MNLEERIDPNTTAVIVVDMQNDFCSPGGYLDHLNADLSQVPVTVDRISQLISGARKVGARVIHIQSFFDRPYLNGAMTDRLDRLNIEPYCVSGTWGAEFIPALQPAPDETVVVKHAYSGFAGTSLAGVLSEGGIRTVILCGTATNNCVDGTGRDAYYQGYLVVLASDAACAPSIALHNHAVETARHAYAVIAEVDEIQSAWEK